MGRKPTKKKLMSVIVTSSGLIYPIAQTFDVTRQTVYNWIKADPKLQEALNEARENVVDVVESKYFAKAVGGSERAQEFLLKTLGKDRGYAERKELDVKLDTDYSTPPLTNEELDFLKTLNTTKKES